ncbi:MAG TPA: family 1 glycosylhydrolase [bacterium]|nr:family 1 glycosylhydrolase [bacterium]
MIHVDFKTQKRTWKKSAKWYQNVIKNNGFDFDGLPQNPPYRIHHAEGVKARNF